MDYIFANLWRKREAVPVIPSTTDPKAAENQPPTRGDSNGSYAENIVYVSNEEKAIKSILRKKPVGLRFTPRELSINIDYKTDDGVTRINYIRNVIRFRCDWKRRLFKSNFTVISEMVVTDRTEGEGVKPIKVRDSFNRRDNFYDKVIYFNDPDFWGDENIIEPTEDLLEGIEKIKQKLK